MEGAPARDEGAKGSSNPRGDASCQSPRRRPRDFLRWAPEYQAERSEAYGNRRFSSSPRRSLYFWKRQRHWPGIEQSDKGRFGALAARILLPSRPCTAAQQLRGARSDTEA